MLSWYSNGFVDPRDNSVRKNMAI